MKIFRGVGVELPALMIGVVKAIGEKRARLLGKY